MWCHRVPPSSQLDVTLVTRGAILGLPTSLNQLDAAWINQELLAADHAARISSATIEPLAGFTGVMGEVMTIDLTYESPGDLPTSFIGKCPKNDDMAKLMNMVMESYKRECGFYRDLAHEMPMRVPSTLINRYDAETDQAILFIERIDGRPGDIFAGCSVAEMEELLRLTAQLHGKFWMDDQLDSLEWLFDWTSPPWEMGAEMVRAAWPSLLNNRPDLIAPPLADSFQQVYVDDIAAALAQMYDRPWTLTHCDLQLDNVIFTDDGPVIVDWQSPMRCFPGIDVAWLLATSATEELVANEQALLDGYRRELAAAGGPSWSHDELVEDLCWALNFYVPGMAIPVEEQKDLPPGQDRQHDRLEALLVRCKDAAERWDYTERMT